jgi:hypothetical protein
MMAEKIISDNFNGEAAKNRRITDYFKPRDSPHKCPQTENKPSSVIQSSIDAIKNDISELEKKLCQIQEKQKSHLMCECSPAESRLKFESKELQVSTIYFLHSFYYNL